MRVLLDSHALLWFSLDDARLSVTAKSLMMNRGNELLISLATFWEIAIKVSPGKYVIQDELSTFFDRIVADNDLTLLPIAPKHAATVAGLPFHHRDPFDRLLIAQALCEGMSVVSVDQMFDRYSVRRIW